MKLKKLGEMGGNWECNFIPHQGVEIKNHVILTTESTLLVCCTVRGRNPLKVLLCRYRAEKSASDGSCMSRHSILTYVCSQCDCLVIDSIKVACTISPAATVAVS